MMVESDMNFPCLRIILNFQNRHLDYMFKTQLSRCRIDIEPRAFATWDIDEISIKLTITISKEFG